MKFGYFCKITNWTRNPNTPSVDEVRNIAVHCGEAGKIEEVMPWFASAVPKAAEAGTEVASSRS